VTLCTKTNQTAHKLGLQRIELLELGPISHNSNSVNVGKGYKDYHQALSTKKLSPLSEPRTFSISENGLTADLLNQQPFCAKTAQLN